MFHGVHDLATGDPFALKGRQPIVLIELSTHVKVPAVGRFGCEILAQAKDASVCTKQGFFACMWMFDFFDDGGIADNFECTNLFHISIFASHRNGGSV
jgi:hypothetical protein